MDELKTKIKEENINNNRVDKINPQPVIYNQRQCFDITLYSQTKLLKHIHASKFRAAKLEIIFFKLHVGARRY